MDRFSQFVNMVISDCDDPKTLGATRLNKILWFSDVESYRATGKSISGSSYIKRKRGPVPATILKTLETLKSSGLISIKEPKEQYAVREYISTGSADESMFNDFEKDLAKNISNEIRSNYTATEISDISHDIVWDAAYDGEEIPLQATLVSSKGEYKDKIITWADSVIPSAGC